MYFCDKIFESINIKDDGSWNSREKTINYLVNFRK